MKIPLKVSRSWEILADFFVILALAAALIRPFFKASYLDKWASIESTFIGDARFLMGHWPHPQWQPLWYGGTRFDYIYPPALRYGTALIAMVTGFLPVKAYHFYVAFFYCVGIAGVYVLVRVGSQSRGMAWLCAAATALLSPSFLFLTPLRHDAWMLLPNRLGVLAKYGDGPHMTALALIPLALAFTWLALDARRPAAVALASLFSAVAVSNSLYGAAALTVFYAILAWSFWITRQDKQILLTALAIPALTYGLTAFWLAPSYFRVTAENMKYGEHGTTWSVWIAVGVAVAYALASDRFARGKRERTWAVFAAGCVAFFSLNVLGNYYFKFRAAGEPARMVPELDLVYIVSAATLLGWLWKQPGLIPRATAAIVALGAFATTAGYLRHAWHMFPLWPDYQNRVEYRISEWVWKNMPDARTAATGSVRFWFDTWHDLAQIGGGTDQGLMTGVVEAAQWELNLAPTAEPAVLWMQSLGVDAVYVSDKNSEETYKDAAYPQKFDGILPLIFDDHKGNRLYRIPRRYPARARVVETQRFKGLRRPRFNSDLETLKAYADTIEKGPDEAATLTRRGTDAMRVRARLAPGQSILVQESYDPGWHAWSAGKTLPVYKDAMGFMAIEAPPGDRDILLVFVTPLENQIGRAITVITMLAVVVLIGLGIRQEWRA